MKLVVIMRMGHANQQIGTIDWLEKDKCGQKKVGR